MRLLTGPERVKLLDPLALILMKLKNYSHEKANDLLGKVTHHRIDHYSRLYFLRRICASLSPLLSPLVNNLKPTIMKKLNAKTIKLSFLALLIAAGLSSCAVSARPYGSHWVPGHYVPGYYHPVWVPGHWA